MHDQLLSRLHCSKMGVGSDSFRPWGLYSSACASSDLDAAKKGSAVDTCNRFCAEPLQALALLQGSCPPEGEQDSMISGLAADLLNRSAVLK